MNFELPDTGTEQPPAFLTAIACQDWLATVPLANAIQAQSMFLRQLNLLHRYTLAATTRFAILEAMLGPICAAQEDVAKKFVGRPLPFSPPEQSALESTLAVWQALASGYLRCFDTCRDGEEIDAQAALVAQRTLAVYTDWQVTLCQGEQLPDAAYWKRLHRIFAVVERKKLATIVVNDPVRHGSTPTRPLAAYAECHLLHTASPFELPARHLSWIARWARRWGSKIVMFSAPPDDIRNRAAPLWIDLDSSNPAGYSPKPSTGGRWLDTTELRKSLTVRIAMLEKGRAPAEVQLGDDVTQPAAGQLLARVLTRWCKGGVSRRHERRSASGVCRFIAGFDAVHFHLSGGESFKTTDRSDQTLRREREEFEIFGERSHRNEAASSLADSVPMENWEIMDDWNLLDRSISGLRISRPLKRGVRVGAGLLVAINQANDKNFSLGNVRWALREEGDSLSAGIQLFPGNPRAVKIRPAERDAVGQYRPGFLLPADRHLEEPPSIVVPVGTFRIGRQIDMLHEGQVLCIKLSHVLDRGAEFERCAYEA